MAIPYYPALQCISCHCEVLEGMVYLKLHTRRDAGPDDVSVRCANCIGVQTESPPQ